MDPTEELVRQLMAGVKCSACGSHYESERVEILGRQEELWFLTVKCGSCDTQGLVAAMVRDATPREAAEARELSATAREAEPSLESPPPVPVSHDDLASIRLFLDDFDGDFERLFGREGREGEGEGESG